MSAATDAAHSAWVRGTKLGRTSKVLFTEIRKDLEDLGFPYETAASVTRSGLLRASLRELS